MLKSEKYFMELVRHRRRWPAHKLSVSRVDLDISSGFQVDEINTDNEAA